MSDQTRNRAGFLLSDTREMAWLHEQILSHISQMSGHNEAVILRRTRTLCYWLQSTVETCFESDPEAEALDKIGTDMARVIAEHSKGDGGNR